MHLNESVHFRINSEMRGEFYEGCASINETPHRVIREMIQAFNEDRLRISGKRVKELYTVDKEDL